MIRFIIVLKLTACDNNKETCPIHDVLEKRVAWFVRMMAGKISLECQVGNPYSRRAGEHLARMSSGEPRFPTSWGTSLSNVEWGTDDLGNISLECHVGNPDSRRPGNMFQSYTGSRSAAWERAAGLGTLPPLRGAKFPTCNIFSGS
jgi:hypothetical protein